MHAVADLVDGDAAVAERPIDRAVSAHAHECEPGAAAARVPVCPEHDPSVSTHGELDGAVPVGPGLRRREAVAGERAVEPSVGPVARHGQRHRLRWARYLARSRDDDLPVAREYRDPPVDPSREGGRAAVSLEAGIESAVSQEARNNEPIRCRADDEESSARLPQNGDRALLEAEIGHDDASSPEARVERSVGCVPDESEIPVSLSCDHDPPVGLSEHRAGAIVAAAKVGYDRPAAAQARIETAGSVVARDRDVVAAPSGDDHGAVRRDRDRACPVEPAHVGDDLPAGAEGAVELSGSGERNRQRHECGDQDDASDACAPAHRFRRRQ